LDGVILDKAFDRIGWLGTDADPILDAVMVEFYLGRVGERVVCADVLEILAVTLRPFFLYHNAVEGPLLRA